MKFVTTVKEIKATKRYYSKLRKGVVKYNYSTLYIVILKKEAKNFKKGDIIEVTIKTLSPMRRSIHESK